MYWYELMNLKKITISLKCLFINNSKKTLKQLYRNITDVICLSLYVEVAPSATAATGDSPAVFEYYFISLFILRQFIYKTSSRVDRRTDKHTWICMYKCRKNIVGILYKPNKSISIE